MLQYATKVKLSKEYDYLTGTIFQDVVACEWCNSTYALEDAGIEQGFCPYCGSEYVKDKDGNVIIHEPW